MEFQGFSPETIDFLWGIRFNNDREWFAQHKDQYRSALYEPMKALAAALEPDFPDLRLHLSRIYRDMRMHPSTFYKDSLWFTFRQPGGPWLEHPCLCFEVRPEGYRYGLLYFAGKAAQMEALRLRISDHGDQFLAMVRQAEKESGVCLSGDPYARPKPCPREDLRRFYGLKNFMAIKDCPPDDLLYSPALVEEVRRTLLPWLPVCRFMQG